MKYRKIGGNQLDESELFDVPFYPKNGVMFDFITLTSRGHLTLQKGFTWDGASGIIDRATNLRASVAHDALYRLMREGYLSHNDWRIADAVFARCLREDGAWWTTIQADMAGLWIAHGRAAHPKNKTKILEAP